MSAIPLRKADFGEGAFRLFALRLSRRAAESVQATVDVNEQMIQLLERAHDRLSSYATGPGDLLLLERIAEVTRKARGGQ